MLALVTTTSAGIGHASARDEADVTFHLMIKASRFVYFEFMVKFDNAHSALMNIVTACLQRQPNDVVPNIKVPSPTAGEDASTLSPETPHQLPSQNYQEQTTCQLRAFLSPCTDEP